MRSPPAEAASLSRDHRILLGLLSGATLFEGFDTALAGMVLPYLGDEFGAGPARLGRVLSIVSLGTVPAFFAIRLADRFGRRPMLLISLGGYALLTLATAFSASLEQFQTLQFGARLLMVTQLALAYVILGEELPAARRGRANGLLSAFANVGAVAPALFLPLFERSRPGWRGLFGLGAAPLLLWPLIWWRVREPPLFVRSVARGTRRRLLSELLRLWQPRHRRRFLAMTSIWFALNFWAASTGFFFTYYVFNERGWTADSLRILMPLALPFGFLGHVLAGWMMDRVGRRGAAASFVLAGAVASIACYQATSDWVIGGCWIALQMLQGVWSIAHTLTVELFPTELRASASGLTHNLLGRWGMVLAPAAVGALAARLGSTSEAVSILAFTNLIALPALIWVIPETRGISLGESSDAPRPD